MKWLHICVWLGFYSIDGISSGGQEESYQLLCGPGHTRVQARHWAEDPFEQRESHFQAFRQFVSKDFRILFVFVQTKRFDYILFLFLLFCQQLIYKAQSKGDMAKVTTTADAVEIKRAKWAQRLTNKASPDVALSDLFWTCFVSSSDYFWLVVHSTCTQTWLLRRDLISLCHLTPPPWDMPEKWK